MCSSRRTAIDNNNRTNTSTDEDLARIPSGAGVLIVGSDHVRIRTNEVTNNNTFGVAITQNPLPSPEPIPNGHEVRLNVVVNNGSPVRRTARCGLVLRWQWPGQLLRP